MKLKQALHSFLISRRARAEIAAHAQRQEAVLRVCTVYPKRVDASVMAAVLERMELDPEAVYLQLARGEMPAHLDEALGDFAQPW